MPLMAYVERSHVGHRYELLCNPRLLHQLRSDTNQVTFVTPVLIAALPNSIPQFYFQGYQGIEQLPVMLRKLRLSPILAHLLPIPPVRKHSLRCGLDEILMKQALHNVISGYTVLQPVKHISEGIITVRMTMAGGLSARRLSRNPSAAPLDPRAPEGTRANSMAELWRLTERTRANLIFHGLAGGASAHHVAARRRCPYQSINTSRLYAMPSHARRESSKSGPNERSNFNHCERDQRGGFIASETSTRDALGPSSESRPPPSNFQPLDPNALRTLPITAAGHSPKKIRGNGPGI